KLCIHSENRFHFLKDLVSSVPELTGDKDADLHSLLNNVSSNNHTNEPNNRTATRRKQ
ncbi:DR1associated protein 1 (Negative cofactor 2 alpha), partial [Caligus rogercresseyi]